MEATGYQRLVISGGVSANRKLRTRVEALCSEKGWQAFYPSLKFCTDNGAMIALAGAHRLAAGQHDDADAKAVRPRWPLEELSAVN